jgi:hypothetical protein
VSRMAGSSEGEGDQDTSPPWIKSRTRLISYSWNMLTFDKILV